jgi:hypothetical protein
MLTDTHEDPPQWSLRRYWPQEFTKCRKFNRQAENTPYLKWLSDVSESFDDHDEDNDDSDQSNDIDDEASKWISDQPTFVEEEGEASSQSIVSRFMKGTVRGEATIQYPDQIEVVTSFCEQACNKGVETNKVRRDTNSVALLDDSTTSAARKNDTFSMEQGHRCRPYPVLLTAQQLREELSKEVILVLSSH